MSVTVPFLSAKPDFSKTELVKTYVYTIVVLTIDYWTEHDNPRQERVSGVVNDDLNIILV